MKFYYVPIFFFLNLHEIEKAKSLRRFFFFFFLRGRNGN